MADDQPGHDHHQDNAAIASPGVATDPVCGMRVDPATSKHRFDHSGQTFHFCSGRCREKFAADPDRYLRRRPTIIASGRRSTLVIPGLDPGINRRTVPGWIPGSSPG
jgi:Cu+-exporting ATPase